jgi:glyoxylase-like metal-dependent hydrolase (beta-lactamase superfamily II)
MKRRDIIKKAGLAAIAGFSPAIGRLEGMSDQIVKNGGFYYFEMGDLQLYVVTDGHALFKPAQPVFAPGVNPGDVEQILRENFLPAGAVDVALNVLVLIKGDEIVLIDTGCGPNFGPEAGRLPDNLRKAGIDPRRVTAIVLTHAHPDHVGGLLDASGSVVFPNAVIYVAEEEYNFWTTGDPDFTKSKFPDRNALSQWVQIARKGFKAYESRTRVFKTDEVLFGCIKTVVVPGHTPGHTILRIFSGGREFVHMADISHDHVLLFSHPEWGVGFDTDFDRAAIARKNTLARLADEKPLVFSFHLPWPGLGHIRRQGNGFEWVMRVITTL